MASPLDETTTLTPRFDAQGLMPAVAVDAQSGTVLMLAYVNEEALLATLRTGEAHYWSRSRAALWHKGATSGDIQKIRSVRIDCDQDALLYIVDPAGPACHTGRKSCFYREIPVGTGKESVTLPLDLSFTNEG